MSRDKPVEYLPVSDMAEELAGLGSWRLDPVTREVTWSRNMFRIHGLDPNTPPTIEEAMSRVHPDDRGTSETRLAAFLAGKDSDIRTRFVQPDGSIRYTEGRGGCEYGPDGEVTAIVGVIMDVTARVEAEKAMATQQTHLTLLAENGADIIVEIDIDRIIRYASPSIRRYGYAPEELVGGMMTDIIHPEDLPKVARRISALASGGGIGTDDDRTYRIFCKDGTIAWVEGNPTLIRDPAGRMTGAITLLRDISERLAAAQALAASEAQLRVISEHTRDVVFQYDLDRNILYASPAVRRYGYEPEDLVGRPATDLIHLDDQAQVAAVVAELFTRNLVDPDTDRTFRVRTASGDYVWMEGQPIIVRDADGKPSSVVSLLRDITESRAASEALAQSETRYRLLAENVTDIVSCSDMDGRLTYLSPSILGVTGYSAAELIGLRMLDTIHPDDVARATAYFEAAVRGEREEGQALAYRTRHRSGEWLWLECNPTIVRDEAGEPVEFIDVTRDVTARERLEEELRAARDAAEAAAAVKSDFMANMSHEIRTPLTAVIGFSSLISARTDLDPIAREHADRISTAGRALLALVNDVLDFSKLEAGRMELAPKPVNPAIVAREALDLFSLQAESKGLELIFDPGPALPAAVTLDPKAVGQVLLNLLGNAVKFSEAGQVALSLAYDPDAQVLKVAIRDSGPGLSAEQARRLFQRFSQVDASSTRRHGGTGLGLAISKGLVEAMGGEIGVDSVVGQGSTFHFEIPAPLAEAVRTAENGGGSLQDLDGLRLLVVDDNPINRELVRAILTPLGIEVTEAVDGASGLDAAAGLPFDIILLDIRMPGLDGPQVLARLRAEPGPNQNAPVLAFSAEFDADASAGFDAFVGKPLDPMALIQAVTHWTAYETAEEELDVLAS